MAHTQPPPALSSPAAGPRRPPAAARPAAISPADAATPRAMARPAWPLAWNWLRANTFVPNRLPARWRHPAAGYVLAALLQVVAAVITRLLIQFVPTFAFPGVVEILAVALIALNWGAGPGVFAALVGLGLEETCVLTRRGGEGHVGAGDLIEGVLFMAVGICISVVASATERSRRQAVEERERARAQAREYAMLQTQERMDDFMAIASHDLRSPLTAVLGFQDLAAHRYDKLAGAVVEARPDLADQVAAVRASLADAGESGERLRRLVALLFDMTRMRAGKLDLRREPCDLAGVVREQVAALRVAHPGRTLRLETANAGPVPVVADADRIGQVVTNYVTNALKYSPADRPVVVRVAVDGGWMRVVVEDRGPGLAERERGRIWQRFYQAEGVHAQGGAAAGLGLGLHICKAIVEGHGGQVGVESEVGRGSAFWFTLPPADAACEREPDGR